MTGPLSAIRIIEFAGKGPGPFAGMMLADHGAEVIRIERPGARHNPADALTRSRRSIILDLKATRDVAVARALCASADGLVEGFRPGVMERLGLGPDFLLADNPRLVYARMTGWGQSGPLAQAPGHDINYVALSGVLHTIGRAGDRPVPPVNYLGDFGGGGMMAAFGMVSALLAVRMGGPGQVIDAAMVDGAALLGSMTRALLAENRWKDKAGVNLLDGAAPFYDTYETADGKFIALGSIEPEFYGNLLRTLGLHDDEAFLRQNDQLRWPKLKQRLSAVFLARSRADWETIMDDADICFAPVLSLNEAPSHRHNEARATFAEIGGAAQAMPAPRYSKTPTARPRPAGPAGRETVAIIAELGADRPVGKGFAA